MSTINLTYSSEMMKNYLHAEVLSPQEKFEALQTSDGHSLLFGIGTDGVFNLVREESGISAAGWSRIDLSSAQIKKDFSGQAGVICRTFGADQSIQDGSLGMAMAVVTDAGDHLYLCLGNSNKDISWSNSPNWSSYPYDNPNTALSKLEIVNTFFCEVSAGTQYIIIDVLRSPSSPVKDITRFYIDPAKADGYYWHIHDLSIDIEADEYQSCIGRLPKGYVDGLYTAGHAGSSGQLVFCPVINAFGDGPPTTVRLNLPGGLIPGAIASTRNADLSTNLFSIGGSALYYFASSNQQDSAQGVLLFENSLLLGVTRLFAYSTDTLVYLWGLNEADQVFYTVCPIGQITMPSAWRQPVPILSGVDLISPYVNCVNNGNTFFAVGGETLYKMIQSPTTGMWTSQSITLPAPVVSTPAQSFSSYTTRIQATDANNQPVNNSPLLVSAISRGSFFINNLYYVLDTTPIPINTDATGSITIIECINSLNGMQLVVSEQGGNSVQINPMDKPFNKVAQLNSVASLQGAVITNADGSTQPLVAANTSTSDLQTVATSNQGLAKAYTKLSAPPQTLAFAAAPNISMLASFPDAIEAEAGDVFRWLESGVESVINIIEDEATGVWHFVATIAGQAYHCVLDCAETIVGAVVWVFNVIKTAIEDLIKFLEFLFEWQDILRTHKVMKNVFTQYVQQALDNLSKYENDIPSLFTSLQSDINKWADIPEFGPTSTSNSTTGSNKTLDGQNSAPANLGIHHFQGNVANSNASVTPPSITEEIFQDLLDLLSQEESTLTGAYTAIQTDIVDQFNSLTVKEIIVKFTAIVVDTLLQTAEHILVAVVKVFIQLVEGMMDLLTATIEIPVLSWLYHKLTGDDLSFLDLICLISAIPITVVYKLSANASPFPKGDAFTDGLINATSFAQIQNVFSPSEPTNGNVMFAVEDSPVLNESRLKTFGFATGMCAFVGSIVLIYTSTVQRTLDIVGLDNAFPKTLATISAIGNLAYVSPNIATFINAKTDNWYQEMNNVLTGISIIKGFVNIPLATLDSQNRLAKVSPAIESIINLIWNVPVIMNIVDNHSRWNTNYKSLIPESIGNFAFNFGGILEFPIIVTEDLKIKLIEIAVQDGLMLIYGLCMPIAGGIYEFAPGQNHS